jgi:hypothetical protein
MGPRPCDFWIFEGVLTLQRAESDAPARSKEKAGRCDAARLRVQRYFNRVALLATEDHVAKLPGPYLPEHRFEPHAADDRELRRGDTWHRCLSDAGPLSNRSN